MISLSHVDMCPVVSFPGWEDGIATSWDQVPSILFHHLLGWFPPLHGRVWPLPQPNSSLQTEEREHLGPAALPLRR